MDTTSAYQKESEQFGNNDEAKASDDEETSDDEEASCSRKFRNSCMPSRLGKCEVCAVVDARYTCPKCELKTCSLPCVRIHKKELDCDGKRDRTKYIPIRNMTNMDFMSDYYFLEECTRYVADRKTDKVKGYTRYNKQLPTHLFRLRSAAYERGTKLNFLLQNFTRHKKNTTYYNWKERRIYWRVEWIFMNASERKYIDERCDENQPVWKLLERYLNVEEAVLQNVPEYKELEYYQSKGAFEVKILLQAEHIKQCKNRFYELDATKTLKENLVGKILVEFPTISIFSDTHIDDLDIIDSDEDVEAETKAFLDSLDEIRKNELKAKFEAKDSDSEEEAVPKKEEVVEPSKKRKRTENKPINFFFNDDDDFSTSSDEESKDKENQSVTELKATYKYL